ncbi:MAG: PspA/IM30 family protein [Pseudomonadota bacterium]
MLKQLFTLARGRSVDAGVAYLDANAIALLRQQMREAAAGVTRSRKAVAVAMAYAERERAALSQIEGQISDLETRTIAALDEGREDLAREAAEAISALDAERDAALKTVNIYDRDINKLRASLKASEHQLAELRRGQRLAEATAKTQHVRGSMPVHAQNDLSDAAATLERLQDRQALADETMEAMTELSIAGNADAIARRLADAGMGTPRKTSADAVLERLKTTSK